MEEIDSGLSQKSGIIDIFKTYKISIILASISLICIVLAVLIFWKTSISDEPIKFDMGNNIIGQDNIITIDIAGGVNKPGVYELTVGSRIKDAIEKAEGFSNTANQEYIAKYVNQAQEVEDGVKLYIPTNDGNITSHNVDSATRDSVSQNLTPLLRPVNKSQNGVQETLKSNVTAGIVSGVTSLININSASQSELESLPGVGPVTATKIIANRPYGSLDDLVSRKVVGVKLFDKIKLLIGY